MIEHVGEINASDIESQRDLNIRAEVAAFFGTLQASFTDFHYLRPIWKKTTEKDVLIVRDEKTGEISVVAGLNADGSPKRTPAKAENAQSFLQFDRHGDVLDNFFRNFYRQCKEPSRFGFYRIAADQADHVLEVMKELLKDPEVNKEMLAPHKVDTSGYEKQVKEEQTVEKSEQPEQKNEEQSNISSMYIYQ